MLYIIIDATCVIYVVLTSCCCPCR